jgi:hypothetical protein
MAQPGGLAKVSGFRQSGEESEFGDIHGVSFSATLSCEYIILRDARKTLHCAPLIESRTVSGHLIYPESIFNVYPEESP